MAILETDRGAERASERAMDQVVSRRFGPTQTTAPRRSADAVLIREEEMCCIRCASRASVRTSRPTSTIESPRARTVVLDKEEGGVGGSQEPELETATNGCILVALGLAPQPRNDMQFM